ncbi:MAG: hypothetical protein QF436_03165 [Candidatus Woesearchaeota archaeon]|jgi:hypothetical protein|nr:hypothetical protein [Candidatus Woesearchaeota archaeon]MDP7623089.1 hypothetical protein [Candidatus Woesearchaeota archaeon]HJN56360.1 hypothetical protein [Candidatus Woesearchaeota archaeon]|tara:strand:+ start:7776 stop:8792 length:1017 start_codon:yes stop_codon:yes gene_type:complete
MNSKKGVIEVQFNWIFVLIIGSVILILITGVVIKQKNISETSKNTLILKNLDAILSGSEVSTGTVNIVKIPDTRINFRCNRYSVGSLSKQLDVMNVFAPSVLEGPRIISMTLDLSMPYRITNIIYLTSPKYKYVFIGDEEAGQMRAMMPNEAFSDYFLTLGDADYEGESKIRFVFFDNSIKDNSKLPADYVSIPDDDVTALNVKGNLDSGTIEFFEKRNDRFVKSDSSSYIGRETLLGAVFTDKKELYECIMSNIFEKLNIVTQIYMKKTKSIIQSYSTNNPRCYENRDTAYSTNDLQIILDSSSDFSLTNSEKILEAKEVIQQQNKLAQLESCATIY